MPNMFPMPAFATDPNRGGYGGSFRFRNPEERQLHAWVNAECMDMEDYARPARELGSDAIKGYMNVVRRSRARKDRSDITFPLLHSVIYSRQAIEAARAPQVKFRPRTQADEPNMRWIEAAIKASERGSWNRPPVDHTYFEQVFDKNLLGVGAVHVGYEFQTQLVHVFDPIKQKMVERTMVVSDDIVEKNVDFFNFGVSRDMKPGMYSGRACYWDIFFDEPTFFARFGNNPFYENVSKDFIPDGDWFMGAAWGVTKPRMWKGIYRVRFFWDIVADLLYVQANGIPIRRSYILDYGDPNNPKKMLPICTIHNDFAYEFDRDSALSQFAVQNNRFYDTSSSVNTNKSFWTKPESAIVKPIIAVQNTFGRAMIDWMKAASVHFVMGPTGVIDRINKGNLYGIEPIKLDAGDFNTKSLVQGSSFLQDFRVADDHWSKQMHAALGRDITRIVRDNPPQATVSAMERELEKARDAQNSRFNSTGGITRKYWLKYILAKQYIPLPRKVKIDDLGQIEDIDEFRIIRDADGRPLFILEPKEIDIDTPVVQIVKERKIKVKDDAGNDIERIIRKYSLVTPNHSDAKEKNPQNYFTAMEDFFLTEKDPEIIIEPLSSFQEESALMQAVAIEKLQAIQPFLTMVYPDGKPVLPPEAVNYIMQNIAHAFGWDVDRLVSALTKPDAEEDREPAPPPYADEAEMMGNPAAAQSALMETAGGPQFRGGAPQPGAATQTNPVGSPPRVGRAMAGNAALAAAATP